MKKNLKKLLAIATMAAVGAVFGYGMGYLLGSGGAADTESIAKPLYYKLLLIPITLVAVVLVVALHELGHVIAGLLMNFEFRLYTVGPFMIEKEQDKLRFKWNTNLNTYGGLALCLPTDTLRLRERFVVFAAGGPAGSLLGGLIAWLLYRWSLGLSGEALLFNDALSFFLIMFSIVSFIVFVVTMIPMQSGGFYSDGARIFNMLKGGPQAQLEAVLLQCTTRMYAGLRPSQLDPVLLREALHLPVDSPFKAYLHGFLYMYHADRGEFEEAEVALKAYTDQIAQVPEGYRAVVWLENVWHLATVRGDVEAARACREKAVLSAVIPTSTVLRADAALAFAEGRYGEAILKARQAIAELPKAMDKGSAVAEKEWLEQLMLRSENLSAGVV